MTKYAPLVTFFLIHLATILLIYPEKIIGSTKSGHWEPILVGFFLEWILMWVYLKGLAVFPKMDLVDIFNDLIGKWAARIFLLPLILFFFVDLSVILRVHAEMLTVTFLPEYPIWTIVLLVVIPLYAAWKGIDTIIRSTIILFILCMPITVFSFITSFGNFDIKNSYPLVDAKLSFLNSPDFYSSLFAHTGFLFLGLIPLHKYPILKKHKNIFWTYLSLLVFYFAMVYIPILIFSQETSVRFQFPTIISMDSIDISWIMFDRLTLFYITCTLTSVFVYASLVLWMMINVIQRLYLPFSVTILSIILAAAVLALAGFLPTWNSVQSLIWVDTQIRYYCILVIPAAVFAMGLIKRRQAA
ncbi:GerAB/ArcD/ProY family transporter [Paenibacillus sp. FJAT-27812]|uniref:GerAB/ArcD/ProY family transporter n=1 Tax=Paenibacillus sp. FJAT-27812 TaxID=1684143 RepID=UPI0006A7BDC6|nr:GerAB/ArcD/ProY family transporter [Paenibacillus sp. FJAT-27812]